jgi:hypothetical protein
MESHGAKHNDYYRIKDRQYEHFEHYDSYYRSWSLAKSTSFVFGRERMIISQQLINSPLSCQLKLISKMGR